MQQGPKIGTSRWARPTNSVCVLLAASGATPAIRCIRLGPWTGYGLIVVEVNANGNPPQVGRDRIRFVLQAAKATPRVFSLIDHLCVILEAATATPTESSSARSDDRIRFDLKVARLMLTGICVRLGR